MKHKRRKEDALEPGGARTKAHTCRRQRYEYKSIGLTDVEAPHATHTDDVVVGCLKVGAIASWVFAAAFLLIFALQQAQAAQRLDLGIVRRLINASSEKAGSLLTPGPQLTLVSPPPSQPAPRYPQPSQVPQLPPAPPPSTPSLPFSPPPRPSPNSPHPHQPALPQPPPPGRGQEIVDEINDRFSGGGPSNDQEKAGVLMRAFDEITHPERPWEPCPEMWNGRPLMCGKFGDRFPSTMIYPGQVQIYSKGAGGFVIRPTAVDILCSYDHDGLTMKPEKICHPPGVSDDCTPGCGWERCPEAPFWRCAWPSTKLKQMMEAHQARTGRAADHNEVVLGAESWVRNLPSTIEAVFILLGGGEKHASVARNVHRDFLNQYGLTPGSTPLVGFDPGATLPFSCILC